MKNKRIILILVIMFTILNLVGVNIYAESNNIIEDQNNLLEENILNNNIMQEANNVNETTVDNTIESEEEKDTTIESEEITEDTTTQEEVESDIVQEYINEKTVKNGVYRFASCLDSNKVIEVAGSSKEDNAVIDIWNYGNVPAQKFNVQYEDGYYKITARHTGKSLTIKNGTVQEGTEIVQSTYEGLDTQKWIIKDSRINGLVISSLANPELAITVSGNIENGSKIVLGKNNNSNNQMIYFLNESNSEKTVSNGKYQLLIGASQEKSMEVAGSSKEDNAKVDIWDYGHVAAQQFNIEYVEEGYYLSLIHI